MYFVVTAVFLSIHNNLPVPVSFNKIHHFDRETNKPLTLHSTHPYFLKRSRTYYLCSHSSREVVRPKFHDLAPSKFKWSSVVYTMHVQLVFVWNPFIFVLKL